MYFVCTGGRVELRIQIEAANWHQFFPRSRPTTPATNAGRRGPGKPGRHGSLWLESRHRAESAVVTVARISTSTPQESRTRERLEAPFHSPAMTPPMFAVSTIAI